MSWYNRIPAPTVKRFFYCPICKSPYERFSRTDQQEHCSTPSTYLGSGEEGLEKARQMKRKRLKPQFDLIPQSI